jgi:hypothetical protein
MANKAVSENPLGLGLVVVGAAALAISVFLPLVQPTNALRMVEDNTLIQHGGWVFLACALGIVGTGYRASQGKQSERWVLILICAFAAWSVFQNANDKGLRTLYPIGPDGNPIASQPGTVASLGIAIYVAGAGVAAAFMGALTFFQNAGKDVAHVAPSQYRNAGAGKPAAQTKSQAKRQRTQAELDAEAEAAEAEAQAAEARARAIRLRMEAQSNAKPAPNPDKSEPHQGRSAPAPPRKATEAIPRNSPARAKELRPGDRVRVVAPGDDYLKVGTVTWILDNGEVDVKLGKLSGTYTYGSDELEFVDRPIRW